MKFEFNHLEKSVLDSLSKKGRVYLVGGIVRDGDVSKGRLP